MVRTVSLALAVVFALPGAAPPVDPTPTTRITVPAPDIFAPGDPPNPGSLFPRRPGAKYTDVEVAPGGTWHVAGGGLRLVSRGLVATAPRGDGPAYPILYEERGLLEAFTPRLAARGGPYLRVDLVATLDVRAAECVATSAADGAVRLPLEPPAVWPTDPGSAPRATARARRHRFSFAVGERRGAFYVTCDVLGSFLPIGIITVIQAKAGDHGVWKVET